MLSKRIRGEAPSPSGFVRVSIGRNVVLIGEGDGTISCHLLNNFQRAPPLWTRCVHDGQVTSVVICKKMDWAFSCGRDGKVLMHTSISQANPPPPNQILSVTGELNSICVTDDCTKLFIAGDSVRCFHLGTRKVHTVPLTVPHPLINVAVTTDGNFVAMASADGSVGVVSFTSDPVKEPTPYYIRAVLPRVMPARRGAADVVAARMSWSSNPSKGGANTLFVPTGSGANMYALIEDMAARLDPSSQAAPAKERLAYMNLIGNVASQAIDPLVICLGHQVTIHKADLVVAGQRSNRIINYKIDDSGSKIKDVVQTPMELNRDPSGNAVTVYDVAVDSASGTLAVVDSSHSLTIQKKFCSTVGGAIKVAATSTQENEQAASTQGLRDETQLVIGGASSSQFTEEAEAHAVENTGQVVKDLIKSNPTYIEDLATLKQKEKERRGTAEATLKKEIKKAPSFVDNEADEDSEDDDEHNEDGDNAEEAEEGSEVESEDPMEEAKRVEEIYRRRYNLGKSKKSRKQEAEDDGYADNDNYDIDVSQGKHSSQPHHQQSYVRTIESFQVGATGFSEIETEQGPAVSQSRYLAFNSIGAIRSTPEHIFVHFHDISRPTIKQPEKRGVLMGAIGNYGFALGLVAPQAAGEEDEKQIVYYRAYRSLGLQTDWSATLPAGEVILNLAVGNRFIAAFTSAYLRIFSPSGLELSVLSFPHHVVCATGFNSATHSALNNNIDPLCITYADAAGDIYIRVLDANNDGSPLLGPVPCALTNEQAKLLWVGWSDEGVLHTADSCGVVRRLHTQWGTSWVPVYDPVHRFTSDERLWIWGASATHLMVYRCLAGQQYPEANDSMPKVDRVAICLPLLRSNGDRSMLIREAYLRDYIRVQELKAQATVYDETLAGHDVLIDKELMKQFQTAVTDGKSSRAIDIACMFQLLVSFEQAAHYSNEKQERIVTEKVLNFMSLRKKMKKRRLSTLPVPGVSEKDKDRLFNRLLESERGGTVVPPRSAPNTAVVPASLPSPNLQPAQLAPEDSPSSPPKNDLTRKASPPLAKSNLFEATPPPKESPKAQSNPVKKVVFEELDEPASVKVEEAPAMPRKPVNPFSKAVQKAAVTAPNTMPAPSPQKQQTLLAPPVQRSPAKAPQSPKQIPSPSKEELKLIVSFEPEIIASHTDSPAKKQARVEAPTSASPTEKKNITTISKPNPFSFVTKSEQATQQPAKAAVFQNIVSDPFASLYDPNETSMTEAVGLSDVGHLGSNASQTLLNALKRSRVDDDEDEDDGPAIQLAL